MGLALQLPNVYYSLTVLFHRFMLQPPAPIVGLFSGGDYQVDTRGWQFMLRDDAGSCMLMRAEFCKAKSNKRHEFLLLHFSHPTHPYARAVAIVDRAAKDRSRSTAIVLSSTSSQMPPEALDTVRVPGQGDNVEAYLARTFGRYDKLCVLEYSPTEPYLDTNVLKPPSAIQISTLLLVVTNHKPNYNLYEYNCYWYADMVFEACKQLFPGGREECTKHGDRGRCRLNLSMLGMHTLDDVCNEYKEEWSRVLQRQKANQQTVAQEWERMFQDERRNREAVQRRLEEVERQLQAAGQGTGHQYK